MELCKQAILCTAALSQIQPEHIQHREHVLTLLQVLYIKLLSFRVYGAENRQPAARVLLRGLITVISGGGGGGHG